MAYKASLHFLKDAQINLYYWRFKKAKYNILTFILHNCSSWYADFPSDLFSVDISLRGFTNVMAVKLTWTSDKFRAFSYEEILAYKFYNFMCIISLDIIILKFV